MMRFGKLDILSLALEEASPGAWKSFIKFQELKNSIPDPKLIISDPDPQIENHEFRIRIQILL